MHTLTKVLVIVNLVFCLILSQFVWISLSGNVQWRERFEAERNERHRDKSKLEGAYNDLIAVRVKNRDDLAQNTAEIAALNATRQALEAWKVESELARTDAENAANDLLKAIEPFREISQSYDRDVVARLQQTVETLTERKSQIFTRRSEQLLKVAQAHNLYAERHEQYRQLEFQQFLMQEELEYRLDLKARYRTLRPDIQAEIGDNGPVIFASVKWVQGNSLQLSKGRRDGVELRQKYTITRNGITIAVVDVVEVQNETCECVIVDLVGRGAKPAAGDEAVTKLFMSRVRD
ncbi:MAG: hypothetical protein KF754_09445 [Planctomycetes bacterium]|nr:hypothetical protein [Planctomycetota bacterium]